MNRSKPSILNKIIEQRKLRLQENRLDIATLNLKPSSRSLAEALQGSKSGFIFECKQSSPSKGLLTSHYQPALIAKQYEAFASAISVLTEPDFFSGSLADLTAVRAVVSLPVLCKDFVIETDQLYSARAAGADVVLLMLSVVTDEFWQQCNVIANQLGLDIITEVHNQEELKRAVALPAKIIGINNRNLHSLETDLSVTESLVSAIPADRLIIAESGISTHQQLLRLAPLVDGFLIGSSLMQSASIDRAMRKLIFGEIKICGLTRREDADLAWQLGASFGGLIFTPRSSRCISIEQAKIICGKQPLAMVGVFMDQTIKEIAETAFLLGLKAVQLHGNEGHSEIIQLRKLLAKDCQIWKTISCSEVNTQYPSIKEALQLKNNWLKTTIDRVLIDTPKDKGNHSLNYRDFLTDDKVMIAGGLSIEQPEFLQLASLSTTQAGFDLCSSLEKSPGIKDPQKIKNLFDKLHPTRRENCQSTRAKQKGQLRYPLLFKKLEQQCEIAWVPFIMLGYPDLESSLKYIETFIKNGADALELGIPFADPVADGVLIQESARVALEQGCTVEKCMLAIASVREKYPAIPIGLLTYVDLVYRAGIKSFYRNCYQAGVDSVLIADLPLEESRAFIEAANSEKVDAIFMALHHASDSTLESLSKLQGGYTYVVSRSGVTGDSIKAEYPEQVVKKLLSAQSPPPVLGFGISKAEHVSKAVACGFKGVISGSAITRIISNYWTAEVGYNEQLLLKELKTFSREMKLATHYR